VQEEVGRQRSRTFGRLVGTAVEAEAEVEMEDQGLEQPELEQGQRAGPGTA